jgi:hypothetical protein
MCRRPKDGSQLERPGYRRKPTSGIPQGRLTERAEAMKDSAQPVSGATVDSFYCGGRLYEYGRFATEPPDAY